MFVIFQMSYNEIKIEKVSWKNGKFGKTEMPFFNGILV